MPKDSTRLSRATRVFCLAAACSLILSAAAYFACSWRWALVGDASLMHYIVFLIERGWAPYRQFSDMNMPGSYLIEMVAMHLFGPGDLAWRLFDFWLMLCGSVAIFAICRGRHWLAPIFAASVFILTHGRDGLAQGGQRDLTMAVSLLAATAFLFASLRRHSIWAAGAFGFLSGLAFTIKPTALLLATMLAVLAWHVPATHPESRAFRTHLIRSAALCFLVAPGAASLFLVREHALIAFWAGVHTVVPYYASLGHRPLSFILLRSLSTLLPLIAAWVAILILRPQPLGWERAALLAASLFGILNCVLQQRALPYYRYPLLAFLLPVIAIDITEVTFRPAHASSGRIAQAISLAALCFGAFVLAPRSAYLLHGYRWNQIEPISSLERDLTALGSSTLSGKIQCIDSISGCNTVLYRMRLEPATGVLSDFLLFGNPTDRQPPESIPVIRSTRAIFSAALLAHPPRVIVVTSHLHIDGGENFSKLERWPQLTSYLATHYSLATEWHPSHPNLWWSHPETPASYRIYLLRQPAIPPS